MLTREDGSRIHRGEGGPYKNTPPGKVILISGEGGTIILPRESGPIIDLRLVSKDSFENIDWSMIGPPNWLYVIAYFCVGVTIIW